MDIQIHQDMQALDAIRDMRIHEVKAVVDYLDDYLYLLNRKLEVYFESVYEDHILPDIKAVFAEHGIRLTGIEYRYEGMNQSTIYAELKHACEWPEVEKLNLIDQANDAIRANENDLHVFRFVLN